MEKKMSKFGLAALIMIFAFLLLISCSDDPTGNDPIARSPIKDLTEYIPFKLPENLNKDNIRGFVKITKIIKKFQCFGCLSHRLHEKQYGSGSDRPRLFCYYYV